MKQATCSKACRKHEAKQPAARHAEIIEHDKPAVRHHSQLVHVIFVALCDMLKPLSMCLRGTIFEHETLCHVGVIQDCMHMKVRLYEAVRSIWCSSSNQMRFSQLVYAASHVSM
jgi:hypothetical protein